MDLKFVFLFKRITCMSNQNEYIILALAKFCYFGKRVQKMFKLYCHC